MDDFDALYEEEQDILRELELEEAAKHAADKVALDVPMKEAEGSEALRQHGSDAKKRTELETATTSSIGTFSRNLRCRIFFLLAR